MAFMIKEWETYHILFSSFMSAFHIFYLLRYLFIFILDFDAYSI